MSHQQRWDGRGMHLEPQDQGSYGYAVSDYGEDYKQQQQSYAENGNHYAPGPRPVPQEYRRPPHQQQRPPPHRPQPNYAYPLRPQPQPNHQQQRPPRDLVGNQNNHRQGPPNGQYRQQPPPPRPQQDLHGSSRRGPPMRPHPGPHPAFARSYPDEDTFDESLEIQQPESTAAPRRNHQPPLQIRVPASPEPPASLGPHPATRNDYPSVGPEASGYYGPPPEVAPLQPRAQKAPRPVNLAPRVPSYYMNGQSGTMVSPIAEESGSNPSQRVSGNSRASYASSSAIPADWESGDPPEYFALTPDASANSSLSDNIGSLPIEGATIETGLVRQASMGKRSKPRLTQIGGRKSSTTSTEHLPQSPAISNPSSEDLPRITTTNETGEKTRPVPAPIKTNVPVSNPGLLNVASPTKTPRSACSSVSSPLAQPPLMSAYFDEKPYKLEAPRSPRSPGVDSVRPLPRFERPPSSFSQRISAFFGGGKTSALKGDRNSKAVGSIYSMGMDKELGKELGETSKKKVPARLDMDAVREAEARGSLTSLPDLIRRATKAAALLNDGKRPASGNWGRDSFYAGNNRSGNGTDSLSDVLNAFPAPLSSQRRNSRFSRLSGNSQPESEHVEMQSKKARRVCGLPLWCFILLIILALVIIAAAVVVPLYVFNIQGSNKSKCTTVELGCQNGGKAATINRTCSCICPSGFTGPTCTQMVDPTCTTFSLQSEGISNANIGSAIPRLFERAASYNIPLEPAKVLEKLEEADIGCTLQNALVTITGRSEPSSSSKKKLRRRSELVLDTNTPPISSTSSSSNREDPAFDFARVALLYLVQIDGIEIAEKMQQEIEKVLNQGNVVAVVEAVGYTVRLKDKTVTAKEGGSIVGGGSGKKEVVGGVIMPE
ncbi:hypothetical protein EX30DRAFT_169202 [Ascodesmis nigricans]|uniref:EGF-like domain-containing protein n=1 Tax=Ascodesmis nigricans TaxID=341454 RepID=A0A4V3SHY1_9PEZI|nr:hypothetical protein EX30DRAFT_169202 [Ascodesmis nigricans]